MFKISYLKNYSAITKTLRSFSASRTIFDFTRMNVVTKETVLRMKEKLSSNESFNVKFYEEMLNMFPRTNSGSVTMNKELFNKGLKEAKTEADIEFLLNVIADYMGNHCALSGNNLDDYVRKAIELNCPNKLIPLLKYHRQLLYYPDPNLILNIVKLHKKNNNWTALKEFYNAIGKKHYIKKLNPLYDIYIEMAFANKDYDECVNSFLNILDYNENQLTSESLNKVVYSNKALLKDSVFVQIFEKALNISKSENFGVYFALMVYYSKKNNEDKVNHYLQKLEHYNLSSIDGVQVYETDFVSEFIDEISSKTDTKLYLRLKDILVKSPRNLFADVYGEKITKILE